MKTTPLARSPFALSILLCCFCFGAVQAWIVPVNFGRNSFSRTSISSSVTLGSSSTNDSSETESIPATNENAPTLFEGTIVVCTGPTCTKKGGGKKLVKLIEDQLDDANSPSNNIQIETVNCVSDCAECGLGPNCEIRAQGDDGPFYPIKNKIQTKEQVQELLGM